MILVTGIKLNVYKRLTQEQLCKIGKADTELLTTSDQHKTGGFGGLREATPNSCLST